MKPRTFYSDALADALIERMTRGEMMTAVIRDIGLAESTLYNWIDNNERGFGDRWYDAQRAQIQALMTQIVDIADSCPVINGAMVARAQLQIKARQYVIDKLSASVGRREAKEAAAPEPVAVISEPASFLKGWRERNETPKPGEVN